MRITLLILFVTFSFNAHAMKMLTGNMKDLGSTAITSDISKRAEKCQSEGYFKFSDICTQTQVPEDICPYNPFYAKLCIEMELYIYGLDGEECIEPAGHRWRGKWTECLDVEEEATTIAQ